MNVSQRRKLTESRSSTRFKAASQPDSIRSLLAISERVLVFNVLCNMRWTCKFFNKFSGWFSTNDAHDVTIYKTTASTTFSIFVCLRSNKPRTSQQTDGP